METSTWSSTAFAGKTHKPHHESDERIGVTPVPTSSRMMTPKKRDWAPLLAMVLFVHLLLFPGTVSYGASSEDIQRWEKNMDVDSLVLALGNKNSAVREAAAKALGRMRDPRSVDPLVNALGDPMDGVRDAAAVALKNLNEPMGERIFESLKGSNKAWEELARLRDPR